MIFLPASIGALVGAQSSIGGLAFLGWTLSSFDAISGTTTFGSLSGGLGGTIQTGDLLLGVHARASGGVATGHTFDTSGYTSLGFLTENDNNDASIAVGWKVVPGTVDTEIQSTYTGGTGSRSILGVLVFRGVDATTPMDVAPTTAGNINGSRPDPASITPVSAVVKVVTVAATAMASPAGADFTGPANMVLTLQSSTASGTREVRLSVSIQDRGAGAFDPDTYTGGSTAITDSWCAFTLALRPA
jgi:hypothetical protein